MAKILVVSDTHGSTSELKSLYEKYKDTLDAFVHCGDSELGPDYHALEGFIAVTGNCDYDGTLPDSLTFEIAGKKIFVTHGHKFGVYHSTKYLLEACADAGCSIALHGHSHKLNVEERGGCLIINPGSLSHSRSEHTESYAILTLEDEKYDVEFFDVKGNLIF